MYNFLLRDPWKFPVPLNSDGRSLQVDVDGLVMLFHHIPTLFLLTSIISRKAEAKLIANSSLARRCYKAGNTDNITEDDLLARMKKMSIRAQNKLVNIVEFLSMTQDTDEPVPMYISRLRGQAMVCEFTVKCNSDSCDSTINYSDNMVSRRTSLLKKKFKCHR